MIFLKKLFGGSTDAATEPTQPETYRDFTITAAPTKEPDGYRIAATIEKDGKTHQLIRADTLRDRDDAVAASVAKARQVIDEQGDRIFG